MARGYAGSSATASQLCRSAAATTNPSARPLISRRRPRFGRRGHRHHSAAVQLISLLPSTCKVGYNSVTRRRPLVGTPSAASPHHLGEPHWAVQHHRAGRYTWRLVADAPRPDPRPSPKRPRCGRPHSNAAGAFAIGCYWAGISGDTLGGGATGHAKIYAMLSVPRWAECTGDEGIALPGTGAPPLLPPRHQVPCHEMALSSWPDALAGTR